MNRKTFLESLEKALYGRISESDRTEHMKYYENYIAQEISAGRSEQEILEELGDPRLIARTIVQTSDSKTSYKEYTVSDDKDTDRGSGISMHFLEGWKAKVMLGVLLIFLFLLLVLIFRIFIFLFPVLLLIGIVRWIIKKI